MEGNWREREKKYRRRKERERKIGKRCQGSTVREIETEVMR